MRTYELVLVFDPALDVEQIEMDLRKLNDLLTANGSIRRWERWGKRRLTYEIGGRQYGYYVLAVFDQDAAAIGEIDRIVRINVNIIRHLVSVVDPKRVPEVDAESVRTLGASPEVAVTVVARADDESVTGIVVPDAVLDDPNLIDDSAAEESPSIS